MAVYMVYGKIKNQEAGHVFGLVHILSTEEGCIHTKPSGRSLRDPSHTDRTPMSPIDSRPRRRPSLLYGPMGKCFAGGLNPWEAMPARCNISSRPDERTGGQR